MLKKGDLMFKKLFGALCLILLLIGIVSAADINSTNDALNIDENNGDEIVNIDDEEMIKEDQKSSITIRFVNAVTGEEYGSLTNTIKEGGSWGIGMAKFNNMIANHKTFKLDGYKYTFTSWSGENGIVDGTQRFYCTGEDYTVTYYANYDKELLGRLTFTLNDEHGHNGHYMTYTDEADYKFTFKEPVDVEEGYEFLYYENAETGDKYNPGDNISIKYSEFKGQEMNVVVDAVYEKIVDNETENETDIDNDTVENADENNTVIGNDTVENKTTDDIRNDTENHTLQSDNSKISKVDIAKVVLGNHKTGIAFGFVVLLIAVVICVFIYLNNARIP